MSPPASGRFSVVVGGSFYGQPGNHPCVLLGLSSCGTLATVEYTSSNIVGTIPTSDLEPMTMGRRRNVNPPRLFVNDLNAQQMSGGGSGRSNSTYSSTCGSACSRAGTSSKPTKKKSNEKKNPPKSPPKKKHNMKKAKRENDQKGEDRI